MRYTAPKARSRGQVADVMLYDQQVINDGLYPALTRTRTRTRTRTLTLTLTLIPNLNPNPDR